MSNGSSDGGDGDDICGEDRFGISCDFFKSLLIGYSFKNELEVEDEGGVVLAEIDEGEDVFLFFKEASEVDSGDGERGRVES